MTNDAIELPDAAKRAARRDKRIVEIAVTPDGWLPNAYKWPSAGRRATSQRNGSGQWKCRRVETIDRKRSHGDGPLWIGRSAAGGALARG